MKKLQKTLFIVLTIALLNLSAVAADFTFQAGHVLTEDHPYHIGLVEWAKRIKERTDGRIVINVFANSTLGNERDMIEALQFGTLDITLPNSAPMANFTNAMKVFDLPFLFENRDSVAKILDGEIGAGILSSLDAIGVVGLAFWENGFRDIANSKVQIRVPADLKGLKIRTMENHIHMAAFRTWGADPTAMAWGEVYTALQQGTIDGLENPITPIYMNKMHEVAKIISATGHFYCPAPLLFSKITWDSLDAADQKIIREASVEVRDIQRRLCAEADGIYREKMTKDGAVIVEDIDKSVWRAASQPVYDQYAKEVGQDVLAKIREALQ